jgi:hypothetical protein
MCDRFLFFPLLALALLFSGCDILRSLGLLPDDSEDEGPPPYVGKGEFVDGAADMSSIKEKFGVDETITGTAGVDAAFKELSVFIRNGGLEDDADRTPEERVIKLGDWIDLEDGLAVDAYAKGEASPSGDFVYNAEAKIRLVVVGINTFQSGGDYIYQGTEPPPHVVFQFQSPVPVSRKMNSTATCVGGYRDTEMREYLTAVDGVAGSGNFLAGLRRAGVPDSVLWAPSRTVSVTEVEPVTIKDKLWLPTVWEFLGKTQCDHETEFNQVRLDYYVENPSKLNNLRLWTATPGTLSSTRFLNLNNRAFDSNVAYNWLSFMPAFCVE